MKNRISLVVIGIIIISVIGLVYYGMTGVHGIGGATATENPTSAVPMNLIQQNTPQEKTPTPELLDKLRTLSFKNRFLFVHKWKFGPNPDEITLYAYAIKNESQIESLQGTRVQNYSIRIVRDTEFEKNQRNLTQKLTLLQQDPGYQIDHFYTVVDPFGNHPEDTIELWVVASTPENRKLDNTEMDGWKVRVYPMTPLPAESEKT
ncbi:MULTISPECIES: hypothetical protein [unclassified Methanoregula]|uniref:hypothetical protein n=1 Tax=unclassified Methanoregula TaxID=2649730 RepID=UPI0009C82A0D|nr:MULTISPECIES: hypothetical protein [unclassified Methanoregula]OPX63851.1 MAG: hypothetical protein A4E33_01380 [Methanoregula sp. PtaB.Bin085]OPY35403.1 MAG: hypothetical protein A4E34_00677 [Methanoregula sp. PtaU1.Bin006]